MSLDHEDSILKSLRRITRAIDIYSRKLAAHYQLTMPQLVCLRFLDRNGPQAPSELAREAALSQATVTGIVDRLEARGLLERRRDHKDRRRVSIYLTPEGKRLSLAAPTPLQELFAARLAGLPAPEQANIDEVLRSVAEMMGADQWKENKNPVETGATAAAEDEII
ncbi:hypothetical protein AAU61_04835 [Desulfocarbo indianensis]|nr:hypothetical protein AAU61_04835 [Desulfocarbo indianensis]